MEWIFKNIETPSKTNQSIKIPSKTAVSKVKTSDTIYNIYSIRLSESETSFLNKMIEFCLKMKGLIKEQMLGDLHFFFRKKNMKNTFVTKILPLTKFNKRKNVILMPNFHKTLFNPSQKYMSILKKSYRFIKET